MLQNTVTLFETDFNYLRDNYRSAFFIDYRL